MRRLPQAVPHALLALQRIHESPARLVLAGPWPAAETRALREAATQVYRPDVLVTRAEEGHPSEFVRSLAAQTRKATAYLCEGCVCRQPIFHAGDLVRAMKGGTAGEESVEAGSGHR